MSRSVIEDFIARINRRDVDQVAALMTEDHRFVDATGKIHPGRETMRAGWAEYYQAFPDYAIEVEHVVAEGDLVAVFGYASGSFRGRGKARAWRIPAAFKGLVKDGLVLEWRVYANVEAMIRSMQE